jgi:hypothetical protein
MNLGFYSNTQNFWVDFTSRVTFPPAPQFSTRQPIIQISQFYQPWVKQENEDWPYFVPPYTEEFQARCPNLMVLVINKFINVLKL